MVVVISAFLKINFQFLWNCSNCWRFSSSRPSFDQKSHKIPLIFSYILKSSTRFWERKITKRAILLLNQLIAIIKEGKKPLSNFLSCRDIKKVSNLFWSIFVTPKTVITWLQIFLENTRYGIFWQLRFLGKYFYKFMQFWAFL